MDRNEVYELINEERDYQDLMPDHDDENRSISDWLLFIEHCLSKAKNDIYYLDDLSALENVRKVAALAVACMEYYDAPPRVIGDA